MSCYLFPVPAARRPPPSDLHETGGIPGNWALDYMAKPGSVVLSPIDGKVTRWSGHDPNTGEHPGAVFGWSLYVEGQGLELFATHLGIRFAPVGTRLCRGMRLGLVGQWPNDPARSHCHLGVSADSVAHSKAAAVAISEGVHLRPVGVGGL